MQNLYILPLQGVLQEALSTKRFGPAQERFPHLEALNGIQSAVCFLWAATLLLLFPAKKGANIAPISAYLKPAITNSIGPACGFLALRNISYPAQVPVLGPIWEDFSLQNLGTYFENLIRLYS